MKPGAGHFSPWYEPQYIIPIAGMIFANAMNTVSLAAERFESEIAKGGNYFEVRTVALKTSMIPKIICYLPWDLYHYQV